MWKPSSKFGTSLCFSAWLSAIPSMTDSRRSILEQFSIECRKTKTTKKLRRGIHCPIKTRSNDTKRRKTCTNKLRLVLVLLVIVACVAGVRRGGRGGLTSERREKRAREARSLARVTPPSPSDACNAGYCDWFWFYF